MKLPHISLLALVCLAVASVLGLTRITGHLDQDPVYSLAAIRAQLAQQPQAWVGQTVAVRAVVAPCPWWGGAARLRHCAGRQLVLFGEPAGVPADPLPLVRPPSHPLLAVLRALPLVGALLPAPPLLQLGAAATYRVRLRATAVKGCGAGTCVEAVLLAANACTSTSQRR